MTPAVCLTRCANSSTAEVCSSTGLSDAPDDEPSDELVTLNRLSLTFAPALSSSGDGCALKVNGNEADMNSFDNCWFKSKPTLLYCNELGSTAMDGLKSMSICKKSKAMSGYCLKLSPGLVWFGHKAEENWDQSGGLPCDEFESSIDESWELLFNNKLRGSEGSNPRSCGIDLSCLNR